MSLSLYVHSALANWVAGVGAMPASPAQLFIALSSADPLGDGSGLVEPPAGSGYARQPVTLAASPYLVAGKAAGTLLSNTAPVIIGLASSPWPQMNFAALVDGSGNFITSGALASPRIVPTGDTLSFGAGAFQFIIG